MAYLSEQGGVVKPMAVTIRQLLSIAIPITIGAAGLQLINLVDAKIVMSQLKDAVGFSQTQADNLKGIYNFCQTLFNLPAAFIVPITVSIIPSITSYLTMKNDRGAWLIEESAVRITALLGLPCGVGLAVLAPEILVMLRGYGPTQLATGVPILVIFGVAVIFNCMVLLTNAIFQAHGNVTTPLINMAHRRHRQGGRQLCAGGPAAAQYHRRAHRHILLLSHHPRPEPLRHAPDSAGPLPPDPPHAGKAPGGLAGHGRRRLGSRRPAQTVSWDPHR